MGVTKFCGAMRCVDMQYQDCGHIINQSLRTDLECLCQCPGAIHATIDRRVAHIGHVEEVCPALTCVTSTSSCSAFVEPLEHLGVINASLPCICACKELAYLADHCNFPCDTSDACKLGLGHLHRCLVVEEIGQCQSMKTQLDARPDLQSCAATSYAELFPKDAALALGIVVLL